MNKEEKVIDFLIAHKNNLWMGLIVLIGGLAGLVLTTSFPINVLSVEMFSKDLLFILGITFVLLAIKGLINVHNEIIKKLK